MGSIDIPPFLREKMKQKVQSQKKADLPPFLQHEEEPEKKKARIDFGESSLEAGNSLSQSNGEVSKEIPSIELYNLPNGEMVETDPISLSRKYNELAGKKKTVSEGTGGFAMGTTSTEVDDEEAVKSAEQLKKDFAGIDLGGIHEETKDLSPDIIANHGKRLMQERNDNPQLYHRDLANIKWRSGFEKSILNEVDKGSITPENYNRIKHSIEVLPEVTAQGDYTNQRPAIQSLAKDIQEYGGENKDELLKNFATEVSKVYGNPNNKPSDTFKDTPESKYLNNDEQLAFQYLKDISPEKAKQYERLYIDPKTLEGDALKGANHLHKTLEETSIGLQESAIKEELNNLKKISSQNGGLDETQIAKATELEKKQEVLEQKKIELDKKYPERVVNKVDDAVNEVMGHELNWGEYAMVKTGQAFKNTGQGIWEAVSEPFMSDASNNLRELAIMGESISDEKNLKQTDKNKNLLYDQLIIQPDLQKQVDAVKADKSLNDEQKRSKLFSLFYNNRDQFGRVPIKDGKFNISPSSILYGVTDLGASLLPFVGLEAATGGIGGTGAAAKFLRTFTAAAATTFHDEYARAIEEGKPQSEAYKSAMGTTAINALAMAGAGTPTEIRAMATGNKSYEKILSQMSDDAIKSVLEKSTPKGLKAIKQTITDRIKSTPSMVGEGLKTGAKFETAMAGANAINDREQNWKQSLLGIANFGIIGAGLGHIGYKPPTELQKSSLVKMGEDADGFRASLDEMKKDSLTQSEYDHRINLIDRAEEAYKILPKANAKGQPLSETEKGEYLYNTVIKNEGNKAKSNLPPKQAEKAELTALTADHANDLILEPKTDKQLQSRKESLEKSLEKKDEEGKLGLTDKDRIDAQAELQAVNDAIERSKNNVVVEAPKKIAEVVPLEESTVSVQEPMQIPEPITINNEGETNEVHQPTEVKEPAITEPNKVEPAAEVPKEKVTGVKKVITDETRAANNFPKVNFPKMSKDTEALSEAKERIDSGKVNPQEMVDRILKEKGNYKNEGEVMDMQYYAHQLEKRNQELSTELAEAKTEQEKLDITNQKLQLSDLLDAQTEAAQTAGNQWGKTGNRMQPVINDAGKIFRENKATIKEAYGGEMPPEVKVRLDKLTQERDEAVAARAKAEEQVRQKMAEKGFEEIKKSAERQSKRKQSKEELKKEEEGLLAELQKEFKGDPNAPKRSGLPITDKMVAIVGKLAVNYVKQGVKAVEQVVDRIYTQIKSQGYTKQQVQDMLAQFNEVERLNKKAEVIENKLTPPSVNSKGQPSVPIDLTKPTKMYPEYKKSTAWVKANQRVANAEFKMKIEKRKAFESQKNMYQRALMWVGRIVRLSVLSGTHVLEKLAAAATIGSAFKRIPEQVIGSIYSQAFKGIAKQAPIEGFLNAKSEARFYKEFLNPKKFVKNMWEILKSGSSPLSKRLGSAEYEHVPILYLPTDTHQIIKDPPKRATFEASFRNGLIWAEKNGLDINDPLVINSIENAAYKRAMYEIFQEQNWLSKKFTSYKSSLEKAGNTGASAKFLVDFMIPVSTVPTNIVRRVITTSPLGLIRGGKEVIQAYRKGIEKLTPDEADHVMQQLKQGSLGTALWLIGWFGYESFGGLYSQFNPNKKREEGDKASDVMVVNGKEIPKTVQHALPLEVIQFAATARRIYDNYRDNKNATVPEAVYKAGLASIGAGLEQVPVISTGVHAVMATKDPVEAQKLREDIDRRLVPQIVREQMDKTKGSEDLKYLQDKGLKIVDLHKESLEPTNEKGERIFVTDKMFDKVKEVREDKIKAEIAEARKKGFIIWDTGETIPAKDVTEKQLKSWLMGVSTKAKKEAIDEVFGVQPEKPENPKIEVNQ